MFEGFPYTNFHELNTDWIIKIAKDFLDQYTNIQQTITQGLEDLDTKAQQLETLLDAWYTEHSDDIAQQLAGALQDLNAWYTEHEGYLDQTLADNLALFNREIEQKGLETLESIPADYTALTQRVTQLESEYAQNKNSNVLGFFGVNENYNLNIIDYGTMILGKYINQQGVEQSASDSKCSDFIEVKQGTCISLNDISMRGVRYVCGYDSNRNFVRQLSQYDTQDTSLYVYISDDIYYIRFTALNDQNPFVLYVKDNPLGIPFGKLIPGYYINCYTGETASDSDSCVTEFIPVKGDTSIYFANVNAKGLRGIAYYDSNKTFVSSPVRNAGDDPISNTYYVPPEIAYFRLTMFNNTKNAFAMYTYGHEITSSYKLLTADGDITSAINEGFSTILLDGGRYYKQIDLTNAKGKNITLIAAQNNYTPVFYNPNSLITNGATPVSGYLNVKQTDYTETFPSDLEWIYQDRVNDANTRIRDAERLPEQRGYDYRCEDTIIHKCFANNLNDALTEIENASYYKYYLDTVNQKLYFSSPENVSTSQPIRWPNPTTGKLFKNTDPSITITMVGIKTKYMTININDTNNSTLIDCMATNTFDYGAFTYTDAVAAKFIRCEAAHCQYGSNGDGFNADTSKNYDTFSKYYTGTLIDCWSHDNNDDGWSEHRHGECTIIGGLYEYNHKGGITPSYGDHCTCYNVISRNNFNGFFLHHIAEQAEGGVGTQLICFDCIAENNDGGSYRSGFAVDGNANHMVLVNCKSIGNRYGYSLNETGTRMTLYDCRESNNNQTILNNDGILTIKNTNLVS